LKTRSEGRKTWWAFISTEGGEQQVSVEFVDLEEMERRYGVDGMGVSKLLIDAGSSESEANLKAQTFWRGGGDV
jgi:hypothetical protein